MSTVRDLGIPARQAGLRILVTGAGGFIGRHLVPFLEARGHLITPWARGNSQERLIDYDAVIHLAGRAHKGGTAAEFETDNVALTASLAALAARAGVRRFVYLSSIGARRAHEMVLEGKTETVLWLERPYQISKYKAECALIAAANGTPLETVILRPPLIYAADAPGNMARLLSAVRAGRVLPFGSITGNRRSVLALPHLLEAIALCLTHPAAANKLYAVADETHPSTAGFVRMTARALGVRPRLWPCPPALLRLGLNLARKNLLAESLLDDLEIDCASILGELGWRPAYRTEEALRRLLSAESSSRPSAAAL